MSSFIYEDYCCRTDGFARVAVTLRFNTLGSNYVGENPNVKPEADLRQTHRGGTCSRRKGKGLEEVRSLRRSFQSPPIWHRSHQCGYPRSPSPTFSWWLNAIYMHSATTKALMPQIAHRDRHVFLIPPWEDNHCSSEKNVQKLTHTSSKGFYPRDLKILQFLRQALPTKRKKKKISAVKFATGEVFHEVITIAS